MVGRITNIQRFSVHDGPGIRTVVFLKGCTLRCRWCCNPEAMLQESVLMFQPELCIRCGACVSACAMGASGTLEQITLDRTRCTGCGACEEVCYAGAKYKKDIYISAEALWKEIEKDKIFYKRTKGGVTFSGGEALLQADFLTELLRLCKEGGVQTAVETCGNVPWESFEQILPWMDLFLFDIKHTDSAKHREYTGAGCEKIMENCRRLCSRRKSVIVRVPVIPEFNFHRVELESIIRFAKEVGAREVDFLPYHRYAANKYRYLDMEYWNPGVQRLDKSLVEECLVGIDTKLEIRIDG
ncbi:MAG: glycyl-radical enzyme activating protein [Lachnospiraceae bacterium]|nr:glycyl-radical enzyme activating protein [Lachnospiraceae bacterium]